MLLGYHTDKLAGGSLGDVSKVTKDMLAGYEYKEEGNEKGPRVFMVQAYC